MAQYRVIHCINQFFAGQGGEEQAGQPPVVVAGAKGPGILLERLESRFKVIATVIFGDNFMAEKGEVAANAVLQLLEPFFAEEKKPDLLIAGPAFNAGRYGLGCGLICDAVQKRFAIPAVTGMFPDNPAVEQYKSIFPIVHTTDDVIGMEKSLQAMAALGVKLLQHEDISPEQDGYIVQGIRRNVFVAKTGAERVVDMLLQKVRGEAFVTEYPMPTFDRVPPAPAVKDMASAHLALITSGGIVPRSNPDKIESAGASKFGCYPLDGFKALSPESHETVHGGYDPTYANRDPNRVLPLDAVRELLDAGKIGSLHSHYYATVGNATSVANAQKFGKEIAGKLVADGVQAVILTST